MSTFNLAISCLTTSICLDSWTWRSRFLCNIALYSIGLYFHHQSHPQLGGVFALAPSLLSFWSYFSSDLQEHIGHLPTCGVIFQCPIFLPFHTVHGVLKARILSWFAIPFSSGPHFVRTLHYDPSVLGGPKGLIVSLSYTRLWSMRSVWLVFCDCGFHSVCPLIDKDKRLMEASR